MTYKIAAYYNLAEISRIEKRFLWEWRYSEANTDLVEMV